MVALPFDQVVGFFTTLLMVVMGGGLSRVLDKFDFWKNWKPSDPMVKMFVVAVISFLVGLVVSIIMSYLTPEVYAALPPPLTMTLSWIVIFGTSQLAFFSDQRAKNKLTSGT